MCTCFQVDFQDIEARTVAERTREEERRRRMEKIYKEKVEAAAKEMEGKTTSCYSLLLVLIPMFLFPLSETVKHPKSQWFCL